MVLTVYKQNGRFSGLSAFPQHPRALLLLTFPYPQPNPPPSYPKICLPGANPGDAQLPGWVVQFNSERNAGGESTGGRSGTGTNLRSGPWAKPLPAGLGATPALQHRLQAELRGQHAGTEGHAARAGASQARQQACSCRGHRGACFLPAAFAMFLSG